MSRWLRNVNALLENLDERVEETVEAVEEQRLDRLLEEEGAAAAGVGAGRIATAAGLGLGLGLGEGGRVGDLATTSASAVDDILAKRGLRMEEDDDDEQKTFSNGCVGGEVVYAAVVSAPAALGQKGGAVKGSVNDEPRGGGGADLGTSAIVASGGGVDDRIAEAVEASSAASDADVACSASRRAGGKDVAAGVTASSEKQKAGEYCGVGTVPEGGSEQGSSNAKLDGGASLGPESEVAATAVASSAACAALPASRSDGSGLVKTSAQDLDQTAPPPPTLSTSAQAASTSVGTASHAPRADATHSRVPDPSIAAAAATSHANLKELRKLRRHVVKLNSDLESAEREIEAQRSELDRAAQRMERDRSRRREEKEADKAAREAENAAMRSAHDRALSEIRTASDRRIADAERRAREVEERRAREGGERDTELADAARGRDVAMEDARKLRDEAVDLSEKVASLEGRLSSTEARREDAESRSELSAERERGAEERLDESLRVHSRQMRQRQAREAELERAVADLGAALVVAKHKIEAAMKVGGGEEQRPSAFGEGGGGSWEELKAQLQDADDEMETLRAQLALERRCCQTLHDELRDLSKEQADELATAHARQRECERKASDLMSQVAKLQSTLKHVAANASPFLGDDPSDGLLLEGGEETGTPSSKSAAAGDQQYSGDEKKETDHLRKQISSLSQKILEQQSKIDRSKGEISTLKNRLRSALVRAETAERGLEDANVRLATGGGGFTSGMSSADEELGSPRGGGIATRRASARRRRQKLAGPGVRRSTNVKSIRSVLGLHPGRIPSDSFREKLAVAIDALDGIAVDLGSHLRHFPLSRLVFLAYLLALHAWAFFLVAFHAHAQGGNVAIGVGAHGPEALLRSYRRVEQLAVPKVDVVANEVPGLSGDPSAARRPEALLRDHQQMEQVATPKFDAATASVAEDLAR